MSRKLKYFRIVFPTLLILGMLAILLVSTIPVSAASLTNVSDTLSTYSPGAAATHTIVFTIASDLPGSGNGRVQIVFPSGFNIASASVTTFRYSSGSLSHSDNISGQTLTITRTGSGTLNSPATITAVVSNVTNPSSGGTYTLNLTTQSYYSSSWHQLDTGSASIAIKTTPTVSVWPTASAITYGQALSASTLTGGTASVPGSFAYTTPSTIPSAGTYSASVTFTPTDTGTYNTVTGNVNVTVNKATPTVNTWPNASAINLGQALSSSTLSSGSASVSGSFAFTTPSTVPSAVGTYTASVTFTPSSTNYNTVTGTVNVTVNKATPTINSLPTASAITYGQALSASTLSGGSASVPGIFSFTSPSTVPSAGTYSASVTFTPTDTTNYNTVARTVNVTVNKATPTVNTWPAASAITWSQALSSSTLSGGSASVPGSFAFTTPSTVPSSIGTYTAGVTFTPTSITNYNTVTGTVDVTVNQATSTITLTSSNNPSVFGQSVTFTATVSPTAAAGSVTFMDGVAVLGSGTLSSGHTSLSTTTLTSRTHSITAVYVGNANCAGSTSASLSQDVLTSVGVKYPSSASGASWSYPEYVYADDANYATYTIPTNATGYGFAIPSNATIKGIQVAVARSSSSNGGNNSINDSGLYLLKGGSQVGASRGTTTDWPTSITAATYGGTNDLWGAAWSPSEINSTGFGVALAGYNQSGYGTRTASVDYITVTVYYVVNGTTTETSVLSNLNPSNVGQIVTFTATVTGAGGTPTGTVELLDGTSSLGTGTLSSGQTTFNISTLTVGSHSITARYDGDSTYAGSDSSVLTQTVNIITYTSTTTVSSSRNPSRPGQSVTFTATVTSDGGTPTGSVQFFDGTTSLGTGTLSSGHATLSTTALTLGTHSIKAVYGGSSPFLGSESSTITQDVNNNLTIDTVSLPGGTAGNSYSSVTTLAYSGGTGPYTIRYTTMPQGVTFTSGQVVGTGLPLLVGTHDITFTVTDSATPQNTATKTLSIVVAKRPITITAVSNTKNYDRTTSAVNHPTALTSGTLISGDSATYSEAYADANAGTGKTLNPSITILRGSTNVTDTDYDVTKVNNTTGVISQIPASVTINAASKTYGDADPAFSGSLSGFLAGDSIVATYYRDAGEIVAGSPYTIRATLSPVDKVSNYTVTYNTASFTISKKAASVTPAAAGKTYGAVEPALTGSLSGFVAADNVSAVYSRTAGQNVAGSPYTISAVLSPTGVLENYEITYNTASFTISKATLTVTANDATRPVGQPNPGFSARYSGFVNGDDEMILGGAPLLSTDADVNSPAGNYAIEVDISGLSADNYDFTGVSGALTVVGMGNGKIWYLYPSVGGDANPDLNTVSPGGDATESVDTTEKIWVSYIEAGRQVTFGNGDWYIYLATDDWRDTCHAQVGYWDGTFHPFDANATINKSWANGTMTIRITPSAGTDVTIEGGNFLAISLSCNAGDPNILVDGSSYLVTSEGDAGYPLPEVATFILFGMCAIGFVGFLYIRRKKAVKA